MKKPTLKQIIECADQEFDTKSWLRLVDIPKYFSISQKQATTWVNEMSDIDEFKPGVMRPGHSTTLVHYYSFIWFLRWKDENSGLKRKIPPKEIDGYYWKAI